MVTCPDVRPDAIVDFDHHSDEFNLNERAVNAELRQKCPVAWNENYGGFWFLTSYKAVSQAARDGDTSAHKYEPKAEDGIDYQNEMGVPRKAYGPRMIDVRATNAKPRRRAVRLVGGAAGVDEMAATAALVAPLGHA